MKKFNLSMESFSFIFSLVIVIIFSVISHFYMQESINTINTNEEYLISCYVRGVAHKQQSLEEFKTSIKNSSDIYPYKVAILGKNDKKLYTTLKDIPSFKESTLIYFKNDTIIYNTRKLFKDIGMTKIIFQKEIDYSAIKKKSFIIIFASLFFLLVSSLVLYFHIKSIYENTNKKLDAFFKDAIHEIRTPLGVVQINLDFLDNTLENSMPLKRAQGGLRNLTSVYESLEYSIKNKKVKYKKEDIDLSQFLRNRIEFFNVLAEVKDISIISKIEEDIYINISRIELQRLIDNNLSNAIKYSKEKTKIQILLSKKDENILLEFSNSGDTIKDSQKIFSRYYRGDEIKGGFGIGLNIVEYICSIYNIKYNVFSKNGQTTFIYEIPKDIHVREKN